MEANLQERLQQVIDARDYKLLASLKGEKLFFRP
jgi:hypothetical protein